MLCPIFLLLLLVHLPFLSVANSIIGGRETEPDLWPWLVYIIGSNGNTYYECAGTLVADEWVLTDVECGKDLNEHIITAYIFKDDIDQRQVYDVIELKNASNVELNIVFLRIEYIGSGDPTMIEKVKLACNDDEIVYNVTEGLALGWGTTELDPDTNSPPLVSLPVSTLETPFICFRDYFPGLELEVDAPFCASTGSQDSSVCDNAGTGHPLLVQTEDGAWVQIGVSIGHFGYSCSDHPTIFSRVSMINESAYEDMRSDCYPPESEDIDPFLI